MRRQISSCPRESQDAVVYGGSSVSEVREEEPCVCHTMEYGVRADSSKPSMPTSYIVSQSGMLRSFALIIDLLVRVCVLCCLFVWS